MVQAAGVPFSPVTLDGVTYLPGQANNFSIYPAIGMAVYANEAERITDKLFIEAAKVVADQVPADLLERGLLYPLQSNILETEIKTAAHVAGVIFEQGHAGIARPADIEAFIRSHVYQPIYPTLS